MINKQVLWVGILTSITLTVIFLNQLIFNINKPLKDFDNYYQYFILENNLSKLSQGDFNNLFNTRMFYPLKNTLALGNSLIGQSILGLPIYLVTKNVIISAHLVVFLSFWLSFLGMYFLIYYYTKNIMASILAGLIFSFNPYVMAQFYFELVAIFFIPLIFLVSESLLKKVTWSNSLILTGLFIGQLLFSFYYTIFLLILWPIFMVARILLEKKSFKMLISKELLVAVVGFSVFALIYIQPYLAVKKEYGVTRDPSAIKRNSAKAIDYFLTSPGNKLYGSLRQTNEYISYTEHSLFAGIVPLSLFILGLILIFKKKFHESWQKVLIPTLIVLILALILSFGLYTPIYFLLFKIVPFIDTLRAPSRFGLIALFGLSIVVGLSLHLILQRFKKVSLWIFLSLLLIICLEYQHNLAKPYEVKDEVRKAYEWLNRQDHIRVILEYPIANDMAQYPNLFRHFLTDSRYLLYAAIFHQKYLINGNAAFIPAKIYDLGKSLTIGFPTKEKLEQLKLRGVEIIIFHKDEFQDQKRGKEVLDQFEKINLEKIYISNNIIVFKI